MYHLFNSLSVPFFASPHLTLSFPPLPAPIRPHPPPPAPIRPLSRSDKLVKGSAKELAVDDDDDDNGEDDGDEDEDEEDLDSDDAPPPSTKNFINNKVGLRAATAAILERDLPWEERLDIVSNTAIDPPENPLDTNDDLKRELAFYKVAEEAVKIGKQHFKSTKMKFTRPMDFFAEMVKSDEQMAKIKDRLIFESKKMQAFEQRKANKEQIGREKEKRDAKLKQKAREKRDNLSKVEEWKKDAANNRGSLNDNDDKDRMDKFGINKKRDRADKKFGFGGKKGKFKKTDKKSMNDMSSFNPRGNFSGGMKSSKKGGGNAGAGAGKRPGKRARDSKRSRG